MEQTDDTLTVLVDGQPVRVPPGASAAAAVALAGKAAFRMSAAGEPRGPLCGMGICFECRVTIDGAPGVRSCRTVCRPGMEIRTADA